MRFALRLILGASLLALTLLLVIKAFLQDIWDQYSVHSYIGSSLEDTFGKHDSSNYVPLVSDADQDKTIVMARMEKDNVDWVTNELPDWKSALYTVNPSTSVSTSHDSSALSTPANKGKESMAYLTYVIDNYDSLPSIIAFLHSHRSGFLSAWHTDTPLHNNVDALRTLKLEFVKQNGYVNLRCNLNPGCLKPHLKNAHVTPDVWVDIFSNTSTEIDRMSTVTQGGQPNVPFEIGAACCAQFAVSRDAVLKRPKTDYERFREWILETEKSDAKSGRVLEFLWHIIFGMEPV